jgi:hypothetical protein
MAARVDFGKESGGGLGKEADGAAASARGAAANGVLFARALYGFARQWPSTAKRVGVSEIAFGALTVFAVAAGIIFGL